MIRINDHFSKLKASYLFADIAKRVNAYVAANPGKPVMIFAHGSSDDGLCWTGLAKELTSGYDIYLVDARGHGLTDPPKVGDGPDAQVEDLAAFIRELKIVKPILMGHSMGSSSVAWFSSKYPDVPKAVILEDPGLVRRPGAPAPGAAQGTPEERIQRMIARATEICREPGAFFGDQFNNPDAADGYASMVDELWEQSGHALDVVIQSVGTAQCILGIARRLKAIGSTAEMVAVEPAESAVLSLSAAGTLVAVAGLPFPYGVRAGLALSIAVTTMSR